MTNKPTPENQTNRSEVHPLETVLAQGTEPGPDYLADLFSEKDERAE